MTDHLEAAVEGVAEYYGCDMDEARTAINRALPHLRRAIIQELANEAMVKAVEPGEGSAISTLTHYEAGKWLSAKLKEAEQ